MTYRSSSARRAATLVEASAVISIFFLFLFGIFEYGRFVMTLQAVENAAREGARYAIAHTNDATATDVQNRVKQKLGGIDTKMQNFQIVVTGIVLRPQNSSQTAGQTLSNWTSASPTDGVSVQVTGDFIPILPSLLRMGSKIPVNVRSVMYSEGN